MVWLIGRLGRAKQRSELALRGWHRAGRAIIDADRRAERAGERLEHRLALVMGIVAAQVVDMERRLSVIDKALEEFMHQIDVKLAYERAHILHSILESR